MMKTLRRGIIFLSLLAAVLSFSGCLSMLTADLPESNNDLVKKNEFGSPGTHVLYYGFIESAEGTFINQKDLYVLFIQLNPAVEADRMRPGRDNEFFYTYPVEVESYYQMYYYSFPIYGGYAYTNTAFNIPGRIVLQNSEPGLKYVGDFLLVSGQENPNTFFSIAFSDSTDLHFVHNGYSRESEALAILLDKYKKTDWEPVIIRRMEELKNGQ